MTDWQFDVPTTGSKHLPPDSRYVEALSSQGYGFEVAVADLVDNSIDAGAEDVVIHFLRDGDQLVSSSLSTTVAEWTRKHSMSP